MVTTYIVCGLLLLVISAVEKTAADREYLDRREELEREAELEKTHVRCCDGWSLWWEPKDARARDTR